MPKLALKYNQDFRENNTVEDIFEDVEVSNKDDNNVLSLSERNSADINKGVEKSKNVNKKILFLFYLFFGLIIFFIVFVVSVLLSYDKISYLDFYYNMKV